MPVERIDRYKKRAKLSFDNIETEAAFQKKQVGRGRSTSVYALSALAILNFSFAYLEHWILGVKTIMPMVAYLVVGTICIAGAAFSLLSRSTGFLSLRILLPGVMTLAVLIAAIYLQQYRIYHAGEMALLIVWLASLNILNMRAAFLLSLLGISVFTIVAFLAGATELKLHGLLALEVSTLALAMYLSYILERYRRSLYLTDLALQDLSNRQQSWAFTLIDLDMALSGIRDFKEMIARLVEHIKQVVDYDSYVFTTLEGKGPKPAADQMEGTLFDPDETTLWPDDLMTKLAQTRHAVTSSQYDIKRGFLGRKIKHFVHFRMDIPLFSDSSLVGVVSLRRQSDDYDDLDMTASVSMAAQAMMIFKRTEKSAQMSPQMSDTLMKQIAQQTQASRGVELSRKPVKVEKPQAAPASVEVASAAAGGQVLDKTSAQYTSDIDITQDSAQSEITQRRKSQARDETVVPQAVVQKIKQETESARKTITLLSRENADHIAVDKYRTAAVESEPLSILLIEVDGLSSIRENDGDQAAYKVFAGIVKHIFSKTAKDKDVLGRYGQNGLSVLLPKVDMNAAEKFAESIRQYAAEAHFKTPYGERNATLSIGVAAITDETGNYESMVKRADMALFVAKKNGRNCVKVRL